MPQSIILQHKLICTTEHTENLNTVYETKFCNIYI